MDWNTISVLIGIMSAVIGMATAYLRLFVSVQLGLLKDEIKETVKAGYPSRELIEIRFNEIYKRLEMIEDYNSK